MKKYLEPWSMTQAEGQRGQRLRRVICVLENRRTVHANLWTDSLAWLARRSRRRSPTKRGNQFEAARISILHQLADAPRARLATPSIQSEHRIRYRTTRRHVRYQSAIANHRE